MCETATGLGTAPFLLSCYFQTMTFFFQNKVFCNPWAILSFSNNKSEILFILCRSRRTTTGTTTSSKSTHPADSHVRALSPGSRTVLAPGRSCCATSCSQQIWKRLNFNLKLLLNSLTCLLNLAPVTEGFHLIYLTSKYASSAITCFPKKKLLNVSEY